MWFKNCHIYHLSSPFELSETDFANLLENKRFHPVGRQDNESQGWVSPLNRHLEHLLHTANGCYLLCLRKEQKVIPASMVKESVEEKVKAIEEAEGRKVYGKERTAIKDDVLSLLKPKALTKSSHIFGYIDPRNHLMVVNAGSNSVADGFIQMLIDSLGSLGAVKMMGEENPSTIMNRWLLEGLPNDWQLTGQYELKDPQDERVAKFKDNETGNQLIGELLEDGYWIQKLGIRYKEQFNAIIQHDLQIKSIKFDDELLNENDEVESEQYARFDADFVLMTQTFAEFISDFTRQFQVNRDKA